MKSNGKTKKSSVTVSESFPDLENNASPEEQVIYYKKEKDILLDISDAIIKVRAKDDLIKVFSSKLRAYFISRMQLFR